MVKKFRLEVAVPADSFDVQDDKHVITESNEIVESIDVNLRKGKHVSYLTVRLRDRKWELFNSLPDPAFSAVPVKLYLPREDGAMATENVFEGLLTSLQPTFPSPESLTLVVHDYTITSRRSQKYLTLKNKTSVQIAQEIARQFGMQVDASAVGALHLTQRAIDIGMEVSGFDQIMRALKADGLTLYAKGKTIYIYKNGISITRRHQYKRDDARVFSFEPTINHVARSGKGGDVVNPLPGGNKGSMRADVELAGEGDELESALSDILKHSLIVGRRIYEQTIADQQKTAPKA